MPKILKIKIQKKIKCSPEINVWNIFDSEHPKYIHGSRKLKDGMDQSFILFEKNNFNITLESQKLPIFSFIKRKSLMLHYANPDNSVTQYSCFWGIPILQHYTAEIQPDKKTLFKIQIAFYLEGLSVLLSPILDRYTRYWLENTWNEDLILKLRREKFLNLGFKDCYGLPKDLNKRNRKNQILTTPVPRAKKEILSHPFFYKNIEKIFNES